MRKIKKFCRKYVKHNEEFVTFTKAAGEQIDVSQMKLLLTKGNDRKQKCEEFELEIKKLDDALAILHKKRKEVNNK